MLKSLFKAISQILFSSNRPSGRTLPEHLVCLTVKNQMAGAVDQGVAQLRTQMAKLQVYSPNLKKVESVTEQIGAIECTSTVPKSRFRESEFSDEQLILFLHGGAYIIGAGDSYDALIADLSMSAQCQVIAPDYGLAPESQFPVPQEQCCHVARALLEQNPDKKIVVIGDSAGGALALNVVLSLNHGDTHDGQADAQIDALVLMSPWIDPTIIDGSMVNNADDDFLSQTFLQMGLKSLMQGQDLNDRRINFSTCDISKLPRTLVQYGTAELFSDQIEEFVLRAKQQTETLISEAYEGQCHDFQMLTGVSVVARQAVARIGEFVRATP